ncbi:transposase [Paraburkholderia panacisoli]|uniref:Transposase n=1 Tax=Paraburkholderia panacisoli TaxID=2603818 RepID=A0A5B0G472_9BURK|nr:transposase [Paraburkholderia panacisoli]
MESTGVYWIPVFEILQARGFEVVLVNARDAKNVPGRKTDVNEYAANEYRKVLAARGITVSMSRKASCWDNAPMESANGTVKVECVYPEHYAMPEQARLSITEYLTYYNTERLRSSLDYVSPSEFERRWRAGNQRKEERAS